MPLIGNIDDLKWDYDPEVSAAGRSPIRINTPRLELRIVVLKPGQYPPYHRHHEEMDEGYLIYRGQGLMNADGEVFEVGAGDILLGKRGGLHNMKNIGDDDLIEFNFRGGKMPSGNIRPDGDGGPGDPELEKPGSADNPYIQTNLKKIESAFDPAVKKKSSSPIFSTPYLELLAFTRPASDRNSTHRHQAGLDEAVFIAGGEGRMRLDVGGEIIEARAGDLIHIPGGTWHNSETTDEGALTVLNIRGGRLPATTERKNESS